MIAVFVNCAAIIAGSLIGILFSRKITGELSDVIQTGAGIFVLIIGLQMAFKYHNIVYISLSIIIGGILGFWWNIDGLILKFGAFLQRIVYRGKMPVQNAEDGGKKQWNFAYAFLNASVLFCVGAMAILGSFKAAVEKDYSTIFTKSVLDGFIAISFAAAMGPGTAFSAVSIFLYQGSLTLLASLVSPYVTPVMIDELTGTGGALIAMIGINLLGLKKIKTANFLPAMVIIVVFVLLDPYLPFKF